MKKPIIKIIKRDAEVAPARPSAQTPNEILMQQQKDKIDGDRDMASAVKTWITERRENSKAEELNAKDSLFAWNDEASTEPA